METQLWLQKPIKEHEDHVLYELGPTFVSEAKRTRDYEPLKEVWDYSSTMMYWKKINLQTQAASVVQEINVP